ncbi:helix-turn-helix domain-containing protein [Undibacterium seohonense]
MKRLPAFNDEQENNMRRFALSCRFVYNNA